MKSINTNEEDMRYVSFVECAKEGETPAKLSLWRTTEDNLYIELGLDDPLDPVSIQWITLDLEDAKELLAELTRIVREMQGVQTEETHIQPDKLPRKSHKEEPPARVSNGQLFQEVKPGGPKVRRFINGQRVEE